MIKKIISGALTVALIASSAVFANAVDTAKTDSGNQYTDASQNLDSRYGYDGTDLGANYTPQSTTFKVWAPTATDVKLNLFSKGSDNESGSQRLGTTQMTLNNSNGVWSVTKTGDLKNKYYTYTITAKNVTGSKTSTKETQDIYSVATGVNGARSMVCDLNSTNPTGWDKDAHVLLDKNTDSYVWEVHVKDFSYNGNSGVSQQNRGKYLAFTETGTTLNNEGKISTCVDYLKELGVTTVQITPFYDFHKQSVDETGSDSQYNWGYDPVNYNVPEGSYSSNPYDGNVRIRECKQMIQALHKAGLSVVMDVVYNHTGDTNSSFQACVPDYYYRMKDNGNFSDGSGCGNETASERRMYRNFMIQSCLYWVNEYHIDGFRFDLMGVHDVETMNLLREALDKVDPRLTIWGEGWTGGTCTYPSKTCTGQTFYAADRFNSAKISERIGIFDDGIRDAVKGGVFDLKEKGWVQGDNSRLPKVNEGILGNTIGDHNEKTYQWVSRQPSQNVSYLSAHDNQTLWDKLAASNNITNYRQRNDLLAAENKLAGGLMQMAQGITFTFAGEEMGRSKDNDDNSYNASVQRNMIDWSNLKTNADIVAYYKGMRQIRKAFSPLRDNTNGSRDGYKLYSGSTASSTYAAVWHNSKQGEWKKLAVIANNASSQLSYTIDSSEGSNWVILADGNRAGVEKLSEVNNGKITVPARSIVVAVDKESFENQTPTEPPTQAPTTEPPTGPPTQTPTQPPTQAPSTEPPTQAPTTIPPTEPPTEPAYNQYTLTLNTNAIPDYSGSVQVLVYSDDSSITPELVAMTKSGDKYTARVSTKFRYFAFVGENNSVTDAAALTGDAEYTVINETTKDVYGRTQYRLISGTQPATEPTTAAPTETSPQSPELGDVNRDRSVDVLDVTTIQKYLALLTSFDEEQIALADYDGNGKVNIKDATKIQMRLAGFE